MELQLDLQVAYQHMNRNIEHLKFINSGKCDVNTKWKLIDEIEKGVYDIYPQICELDYDTAADTAYRYYLLLNNLYLSSLDTCCN